MISVVGLDSNTWTHLRNAIVKVVLRRQEGRAGNCSSEKWWLRISTICDNLLQNWTCASWFPPDSNFIRVSTEFADLKRGWVSRLTTWIDHSLTCFCTHCNAACWSTDITTSGNFPFFLSITKHLHKPAFSTPLSLTFSPGRNPNNPSRYWMTTARTPPPASRIKSLPL